MNKIWPLGNKNIKIDAYEMNDTMVKFRIKDKATRERILRRGMWSIVNIPMVVSKWAPIEEEEIEPEIKTIPMWNVPRRMFSWEGLGFIASAVGKPKRLHPDTLLCNSFEEAKVFVDADVAKGFPKKHRFTSKLGIDAEVEFTYPWLPDRCNICSKWGHLAKTCRETGVVKLLTRDSVSGVKGKPESQLKGVEETVIETPEANHKSPLKEKSMPVTELSYQEEKEMGGKKEQGIVAIRSETQQEEKQSKPVTATQNSWSIVSPARVGRVAVKQPENMQVGTPSRFAILEDVKEGDEELGKIDKGRYGDPGEEKEANEKDQDKEEGEINIEKKDDQKEVKKARPGNQEEREEERPPRPSSSNSQTRVEVSSDSKASTKGHPSAAVRKRRAPKRR
ncbi:hypothetical protein Bca4012_063680 [Brassica carinata]